MGTKAQDVRAEIAATLRQLSRAVTYGGMGAWNRGTLPITEFAFLRGSLSKFVNDLERASEQAGALQPELRRPTQRILREAGIVVRNIIGGGNHRLEQAPEADAVAAVLTAIQTTLAPFARDLENLADEIITPAAQEWSSPAAADDNQAFGPMYVGRHGASFRLMAVMTDLDAQMVKPDDVAKVEFSVCDERDQNTELFCGELPVNETVLSEPETKCWNGEGGYNFRWDVPPKTFSDPKIPYLLTFILTLKSGHISSGLGFRIRATERPIHFAPDPAGDGPFGTDGFRIGEKEASGMPPTAWRLSRYLWNRSALPDQCTAH